MPDDRILELEEISKIATTLDTILQKELDSSEPHEKSVESAWSIELSALVPKTQIAMLVHHAQLSALGGKLLRILIASELDIGVLRSLRALSAHSASIGVEVGALVIVLSRLGHSSLDTLALLQPDGPLIGRGLARWLCDDVPLLRRRIAITASVLRFVLGTPVPTSTPFFVKPAPPLERLISSATQVERVRRMISTISAGGKLWLVGAAGLGKRSILSALCAEVGRPLICVDYREIKSNRDNLVAELWCESIVSKGAIICIYHASEDPNDPPGKLPRLIDSLHRALLPIVCTSDEIPTLSEFDTPPEVIEILPPTIAQRAKIWRQHLPACELADELAARFRLVPARVVQAATAAQAAAAADGRTVVVEDVMRALSLQVARQMTALGTKIEDRQTWDDIVLPAETLDAIREIRNRVTSFHKVVNEWGFRVKLGKGFGLTALFHGPPGTGKTMVASLIARDLGLELYQIDLSQCVSKYIGETEKNLRKIFDAADGSGVMLLFDEADALFTKRTDVKSSTDRYANLEINYLLQRLERFEGIAILTTNLEGLIDSAFRRRLAFQIHFQAPDQKEREALWRRMIPSGAVTDGKIDFAQLAKSYEMTGGNIRNAMLRAAFLAAGEAAGVITGNHVLRAIRLEYRDAGRLSMGGRLS